MSEIVFCGESFALRSFAASGAADDEKHLAAFEDESIQSIGNVLEDRVGTTLGVYL